MTSPPGPRHVSGVEIGNEMDIYFHQKAGRAPHRNASYTEEEYEVREPPRRPRSWATFRPL